MQIVGYERATGGDPASLLLADEREISRRSLAPREHLDFGLGERHCAGSVSDGEHRACTREPAPYCDVHRSSWPCARCTGTCAMPIEDCHEEHAVYLAGFAPDTFKVGVTKHWRLETRLAEQGADRGAHIRTVEDGRRARAIEAELAKELTDRVRIPTKVASLYRPFDESAWESLLAEYDVLERFTFEYPVSLGRQPVRETLASGRVVGTKGRLLVLEQDGTTYGVDMRDLVGHEITSEPAAPERQSSLGAYE